LLLDVIPIDNILFASEMVGAVRGIDPETGHYFDDTKRYIDGNHALTDEDRTNRSLAEAYKTWEENVKKGRETAEALTKRFAPWYYVISASSFDKIHLNRGDLVKRKET